MKGKPEYESEPELHRVFDLMLEWFDSKGDADLAPRIDGIEQFLELYRLQGSPLWHQFYEMTQWQLVQFLLSGSEKAFGLDPIVSHPSPEQAVKTLEQLLLALSDKSRVDPTFISDDIKLRAVQLYFAHRCLAVMNVCQFQYKAPIAILIEEAMDGDEDAFLALVKLDSAFLYTSYGMKFLIEAELKYDSEFKSLLADALDVDPKFWTLKGKRNHFIFLTLADLDDYAYRSDRDWADFFAHHDLPTYRDVNNVRMQRKRYNLEQLDRE